MVNKEHIQSFYACMNYIPSKKNLRNLKNNINNLIPIIKFLSNKYDANTPEKLRASVNHFTQLIFESCTKSHYVDSRLYEVQAINAILKNPSIIEKEYPEIKDVQNNHTVYTSNSARSQRLVLINALDESNLLEKFARKYDVTSKDDLENIVINAENPEEIMNLLRLAIELMEQKSIKDKILLMLKEQKKLEKTILKNL